MQFKQLQSDMIAAMKARDKDRKDAISVLVSAVKKDAIDKGLRDDIPEELVDKAIMRETKLAKEQIDTCPAGREDLKTQYEYRYSVFSEYAPKMMSAEEIEAFIKTEFPDLVASKNKGMLMKNVMGKLNGKADGKDINKIVSEMCK